MIEYPIVVVPLSDEDGGGFLSYAPDLPGCVADGETRAEAVAAIADAIAEWTDTQEGRGLPLPEPGSAGRHAADREAKLLDAIQSLAEYGKSADSRIRELERKLTELIAVLKDDAGRIRAEYGVPEKLEVGRIRRSH